MTRLSIIFLMALFLLTACADGEEDTTEAIAEELLVDSPAAVGAVRGGLPFELPKPRHSKADCLPVFAESLPVPAEEEFE